MKKIAVVALDPLAGASYTKEVRDLFGEYAEVVGYSVRDGSREFDTSKLKRIPQSLETGLFFVKFLFLLYSNI